MLLDATTEDPLERRARPFAGRATFTVERLDPPDPRLHASLREWDWVARSLLSGGAILPATRTLLEDHRRIAGELSRVLAGAEDGEGTAGERIVRGAFRAGRLQAATTVFPCRRAVFVELLVTAPWNLLGPEDPADARVCRGAGTTLLAFAEARSLALGLGGRVALQAENRRCLGYYRRLGFELMRPDDQPLTLVPCGATGFSASIRRLAGGAPGPEEIRSPWLLRDPARAAAAHPEQPQVAG
ncbi:MAG TPA: N-acetyltransferase [Anaeromyxobacter sp.]|nr:N-acetyltransferase [Anaeromyxobacter sp.]